MVYILKNDWGEGKRDSAVCFYLGVSFYLIAFGDSGFAPDGKMLTVIVKKVVSGFSDAAFGAFYGFFLAVQFIVSLFFSFFYLAYTAAQP